MRFPSISHNVSWLCFVADKQAQNIELKTKLTNTHPSIE